MLQTAGQCCQYFIAVIYEPSKNKLTQVNKYIKYPLKLVTLKT